MKKTLLALVIASLPAAAFADVTVYGKANVAIQNADEVADSRVELVSNASRIGLKGGEDINSSLKVIYQFEYQTEVDDGMNGSQTFGQRNIFLGLQGTAGTFIGGHFDTPTKVAQEKVDLFSNELQINDSTPPAYLTHAADDNVVDVDNSINYFEALRKRKIAVEMHIYPKGGHGFIFRQPSWMDTLLQWMKNNKWLN